MVRPRPSGRLAAARLLTRAAVLAGSVLLAGSPFLGSVLPVPAGTARADVDITLGNRDQVTGTLLAEEEERYYVALPQDTALTVSVKAVRKKGRPVVTPRIQLRGPQGGTLPTTTTDGPTSARLSKFVVGDTGTYTIVLTAAGDSVGDYRVVVSWKSPTSLAASGTVGDGLDLVVPFDAESGSTATLVAAPARGSAAVPRIARVDDVGVGAFDVAPEFPAPGAPQHAVKNLRLGGAGRYRATLTGEAGSANGDVRFSVSLKPPRAKPRKVVVTTAITGGDPDFDYAKGGVVGPSGGFVDGGIDGQGPIDGASLLVPPGALSNPVVIVLSTADPFTPPGVVPAGPGVNFSPDGLQFAPGKAATITLPFDPDAFPDGDTSGLQVFVQDGNGNVNLVPPPYVIDYGAGTVSFPASHFSAYRVFGPSRAPTAAGRADLNADGFDDLVAQASGFDDAKGRVTVFYGRADFDPSTVLSESREGGAFGDEFGGSVATADVNGDGVADLLVGAPGSAQAVYIWFGGTGFTFATRAADATLTGGRAAGEFGATIAVGNVLGGTEPEILVGAPLANTSASSGGKVYAFSAAAGFAGGSADAPTATFDGADEDGRFGSFLHVRPLRGDPMRPSPGEDDAFDDLVVGSVSPATAGSIHLIPGAATLTSGVADALGTRIDGQTTGDAFGIAAGLGDLNGDGFTDLAIGAPGFDVSGDFGSFPDSGNVYVFFGPALASSSLLAADDASLQLDAFPSSGGRRGHALVVGQFFGDSVKDLVFGAPNDAAAVPEDGGSLFLVRGDVSFPPGFQIGTIGPIGSRRGAIVLPLADYDGDGRLEFGFSEPGIANGDGIVTVIFGATGFASGRGIFFQGIEGEGLGSGWEPEITIGTGM